MNRLFLGRVALVFFGVGFSACNETTPAVDGDVIVQPAPPTTAAEHQAQLAAVDQALDKDPGNPRYLKWAHDLNAITDAKAGLFYSFDTPAGTTILLYEPRPGMFAAQERGNADSVPALGQHAWVSPAELFSQVKPGEPVPAELVAADERQKMMLTNPPSAPVLLDDGPVGPDADPMSAGLILKHATSSCAHFRDDHAGCFPTPNDGSWCACNLAGDTFGQRSDMTHSFHRITVYQGNISVNFTVNTTVRGYAIVQGEQWWFEWFSDTDYTDCSSGGAWGLKSPTCALVFQRRLHKGAVTNASGDQYHWGACFDAGIRVRDWHCPQNLTPPASDG